MALYAKRPRRELCPEGVHRAIIANVEEREHEAYGQQIQITFELDDLSQSDGSPMLVFKSCSFKLTPKANLTKAVEAILGKTLTNEEATEGIDLETLVGIPVQVVVNHQESQSGGNLYSVVDSIVSLNQEATQTPF